MHNQEGPASRRTTRGAGRYRAASLAHSLRALRRDRGLSLSDTARASGVSKATLSGLEAGRGNPTLTTILGLARALEVSAGRLLGDE